MEGRGTPPAVLHTRRGAPTEICVSELSSMNLPLLPRISLPGQGGRANRLKRTGSMWLPRISVAPSKRLDVVGEPEGSKAVPRLPRHATVGAIVVHWQRLNVSPLLSTVSSARVARGHYLCSLAPEQLLELREQRERPKRLIGHTPYVAVFPGTPCNETTPILGQPDLGHGDAVYGTASVCKPPGPVLCALLCHQ
jgi:hypothetical protein